MYVRRKVFSWAIDPWDGEEKLFSTKEVEGDKKGKIYLEDGGMTWGDSIRKFGAKHLMTKKDREAVRKSLREGDYHPLAKRYALYNGIAGGLLGAGAGLVTKNAKVGLAGAAIMGPMAAGLGYIHGRAKKLNDRIMGKISSRHRDQLRKEADMMDLVDGKISKEEYTTGRRH